MLEWLWPKPTTSANENACPVDHATKSACPVPHHLKGDSSTIGSRDRVVSSIPRWSEDAKEQANWVYPSTSQFYESLQRKNRDPDAKDMNVVVPIHNAVNEQAWEEVLKWETLMAPKEDIKLVSFKGRPQDTSPKAWFKTLIG
jgi:cytochrome c heme-lyase